MLKVLLLFGYITTFFTLPNVVNFKTPSGIQVFFTKLPGYKTVSLQCLIKKSGTAYNKPELINLLLECIKKCDGKQVNSNEFEIRSKELGINFDTTLSKDYVILSYAYVKNSQDEFIKQIRERLFNLTFDKFEQIKENFLSSIIASYDKPKNALDRKLYTTLYKNHQYGQSIKPELISSTKKIDVETLYNNSLTKKDLVIVIAGDLTKENIINIVDGIFKGIKLKKEHPVIKNPKINEIKSDIEINQNNSKYYNILFFFNHKNFAFQDGKKTICSLLATSFLFSRGNGANSLLFKILRESGLVYYINFYLNIEDYSQIFTGYTATNNYQATKKQILKILRTFKKSSIKPAELEDRKNYLKTYIINNLRTPKHYTDFIIYCLSLHINKNCIKNYINIIDSIDLKYFLNFIKKDFLNGTISFIYLH